MPNHNTAGSRSLPGVLFVALFAVIGLTACSGGGGSTSATTPTATYTITASTGAGGTVTPSGATTVNQGASQSYTITPGAGYAIATLVVDGITVATSSTHTFTNVQANHTISATFSILPTYTITASTGAGGTVTPSGATTVSQGASQSYTITPDANYAIATLVIDGTTVATSSTHTFTNVQANHTISATFSAAVPGGIVLSLVPARTSGVAPLAVFFDASGTTDIGVTTRPFHDLEYTWSFGDPSSGTWASGAQPGVSSRNSATGPVAAHVFESPGIYTVSLTAFDGTNSATTNTTITVDDPNTVFAGANTICVSANSDPVPGSDGCPADAAHYQQASFPTIISTYAITGHRVLLKRGDTFTASANSRITSNGPATIGAFGSGVLPVIQMTGGVPTITFSGWGTPLLTDWRVMDLVFECGASGTSTGAGINADGGVNRLLMLRLTATGCQNSFGVSDGAANWHNTDPARDGLPAHVVDQISIIDSSAIPVEGNTNTETN